MHHPLQSDQPFPAQDPKDRQMSWLRSAGRIRGWAGGGAGTAAGRLDGVSRPGKARSIWGVSFMVNPPSTGRWLKPTDFQGVPVPDNPFQAFALLQFQGGGQRRRTDHIVLAVLASPADDLKF